MVVRRKVMEVVVDLDGRDSVRVVVECSGGGRWVVVRWRQCLGGGWRMVVRWKGGGGGGVVEYCNKHRSRPYPYKYTPSI